MPYILRYAEGGEEKELVVYEQELSVGRAPDCGLVLTEPGISRSHCRLTQTEDGVFIEDLGSKNGTRVNNVYISKAKLSPSDTVTIAEFPIVFEPRQSQSFKIATGDASTDRMVRLSEDKQLHEEAGTIIRRVNEAQDIIAQYEKTQKNKSAVQKQSVDAQRIMRVVIEVAKALIAVKSVDEIIEKLMRLVFENLPADRGCLMLHDLEGVLRPKVVHHRDERSAQDAINISQTIVNKALNDKMAILTTDAQVDPRFSAGESIRFLGIKSAMCVPLFHKQNTIGIIYLDSPTSAAIFGPSDLDLLTAMANFAAVGIEQARLNEKVQKEMSVRQRLERYHSPSIVSRILKDVSHHGDPREYHLSAEERDVSVLFADIVGFTPMSARLSPGRVAELLNEYFSEMTEVIFEYEGTLDKYIGDAIMAIFGAPNIMENHPYRAVCASLDMLDRLDALNKRRVEDARFSIRIGINTGSAVAGDIGSIKRMDYTVLGNTVNLAARIEAMACKPNQVVVGESTFHRIHDQFVTEDLGGIQLKGIKDATNVYRIISRS